VGQAWKQWGRAPGGTLLIKFFSSSFDSSVFALRMPGPKTWKCGFAVRKSIKRLFKSLHQIWNNKLSCICLEIRDFYLVEIALSPCTFLPLASAEGQNGQLLYPGNWN